MLNQSAKFDKVICPYFKNEKGTGLSCAGLLDDTVCFRSIFKNSDGKNNQMDSFCMSYCWKGCPIAQMLQQMNR